MVDIIENFLPSQPFNAFPSLIVVGILELEKISSQEIKRHYILEWRTREQERQKKEKLLGIHNKTNRHIIVTVRKDLKCCKKTKVRGENYWRKVVGETQKGNNMLSPATTF